jgi:hypothetical protein
VKTYRVGVFRYRGATRSPQWSATTSFHHSWDSFVCECLIKAGSAKEAKRKAIALAKEKTRGE